MIRLLNLIFQPIAYTIIIGTFALVVVPISIIAVPFPLKARTLMCAPFWQIFSFVTIYVATLSKADVKDLRPQDIRRKHPRGLYIANHQSFMDIPLIITRLPIPPIMKKEVLYIPLIGICGYSAGAMIVDRKDKDSRRKVFEQAKQRLSTGLKSLMFYPEGTRQKDLDCPKSFEQIKRPIIKYAYENNIPVYPVSVFGTKRILKARSATIHFGKKIGMVVHNNRAPEEYSSSEEFIKDCWSDVVNGYDELAAKLT